MNLMNLNNLAPILVPALMHLIIICSTASTTLKLVNELQSRYKKPYVVSETEVIGGIDAAQWHITFGYNIVLGALAVSGLPISFLNRRTWTGIHWTALLATTAVIFVNSILTLIRYLNRSEIGELLMRKRLKWHGEDRNITDFWDDIHTKYGCCGIRGPNDWLIAHGKIPPSCCNRRNAIEPCLSNESNSIGCGHHVIHSTRSSAILNLLYLWSLNSFMVIVLIVIAALIRGRGED